MYRKPALEIPYRMPVPSGILGGKGGEGGGRKGLCHLLTKTSGLGGMAIRLSCRGGMYNHLFLFLLTH